MRPGTGFRVILDGEGTGTRHGEPFDHAVVEIAMGHGRPMKRTFINCVIVILTGDFNVAGLEVHDGMIGPMVTERKLVGRRPK